MQLLPRQIGLDVLHRVIAIPAERNVLLGVFRLDRKRSRCRPCARKSRSGIRSLPPVPTFARELIRRGAEGGGGRKIPTTQSRTQVRTRFAQTRTQLRTRLWGAARRPARKSGRLRRPARIKVLYLIVRLRWSAGLRRTTPNRSRSTRSGGGQRPPSALTQSPPLELRPPWDDYPTIHPREIHSPRGRHRPHLFADASSPSQARS
jgi:hypothetical protein